MSSSARAERLSYQWIDRQDDLELLVDTLLACPRYALDTEFHRERTYFPKLALVQVAWLDESLGQQVALIDPLAVDVHALAPLLTSDVLCVIHAEFGVRLTESEFHPEQTVGGLLTVISTKSAQL